MWVLAPRTATPTHPICARFHVAARSVGVPGAPPGYHQAPALDALQDHGESGAQHLDEDHGRSRARTTRSTSTTAAGSGSRVARGEGGRRGFLDVLQEEDGGERVEGGAGRPVPRRRAGPGAPPRRPRVAAGSAAPRRGPRRGGAPGPRRHEAPPGSRAAVRKPDSNPRAHPQPTAGERKSSPISACHLFTKCT